MEHDAASGSTAPETSGSSAGPSEGPSESATASPQEQRTVAALVPPQADYLSALSAWASRGSQDEYRADAVELIQEWFEDGGLESELSFEGLNLRELPPLPAGLRKLNVDGNPLNSLGAALPSSLTELHAAECGLTDLPELPGSLTWIELDSNQLEELPPLPHGLRWLGMTENRLSRLPDDLTLPQALETLDLRGNQLDRLPNELALPPSLETLNLSDNHLTALPWHGETRSGAHCVVIVGGNPFSPHEIARLKALAGNANYFGPRITFSEDEPPLDFETRPLANAVVAWYEDVGQEADQDAWSEFEKEEGGADFSTFLDRLRASANFPFEEFRQSVVELLTTIAADPRQRSLCFRMVMTELTRCEDRVTLAMNALDNARRIASVEAGDFDRNVAGLVSLARGMFRLAKLAEIAKDKVTVLEQHALPSDPPLDPIQVYLAYQIGLRQRLNLPISTFLMRAEESYSKVTQSDLNEAELRVRDSEATDFVHFLSTEWGPWQSFLQRNHAEEHESAKEELIDAMGDEFNTALERELEQAGLPRTEDTERVLGVKLKEQIAHDINGKLLRSVLARTQLLHLLDSPEPQSPETTSAGPSD
ncbi:NEL-type E3 ubiquitin ligase domain-containing protein [Noviherbaspirillum aridicola]|uniref:NEL-type E3 ubiquitin ligase domain-containing protein n=1 Tax=Noviherbaspirillum aridicola TaxID=2849687 RepID=UPI001C81DDCA|nr:NEL-type E3 ubiquitin ligase domain-containing protein [Noviherbaspirillum aridicola]